MKRIIFIHGMFQNAGSWKNWVAHFNAEGYECIAESWPMHEGEPLHLRAHLPHGLGGLGLQEVIDRYITLCKAGNNEAILIGHSVGGLIVQSLLNKGMGSAGICISSVAPNRMFTFDRHFFSSSFSIANPFKGDEPFYMTPEGFHETFCNTLSREESDKAYEETVVHDSRNILRDCLLDAGEVAFEKTRRPLLFIAGEKDHIIPAGLNEKNAKAYPGGLAAFSQFANRSHFICNEPGWEEVASFVSEWLVKQELAEPVIH